MGLTILQIKAELLSLPFCQCNVFPQIPLSRWPKVVWTQYIRMSVNAKNFNVKVPTKVNTRAELCDKKSIFGSLCVLRTEVWGLGSQHNSLCRFVQWEGQWGQRIMVTLILLWTWTQTGGHKNGFETVLKKAYMKTEKFKLRNDLG